MRLKHIAALSAAIIGICSAQFFVGTVANAAPALPPMAELVKGVTRETTELRLLLALNGRPTYLGRISATTSAKNNADATAFTIPQDAKVLLVCSSAAVRILPDTDVTEDITTANGVPVAANACWWMILKTADEYLQAITAAGTADVDVWRLD
jgi:hypothetical protein